MTKGFKLNLCSLWSVLTMNKSKVTSFSSDHHHQILKITNPFANWWYWPHSFIFSYIYKERKVLTSIHKKKMRAKGKRLIIPPVGHVINVGTPITGLDRPPHAITNTISGDHITNGFYREHQKENESLGSHRLSQISLCQRLARIHQHGRTYHHEYWYSAQKHCLYGHHG